jgi:plasmid stabilization system protein ParE
MSYTVMFLEDAERDLRNIHAYVAGQFSEKLANKIYTDIRDAILRLEDNPLLGHTIPQIAHLGMTDFRQIVVEKRNKVIYQIDTGKKRLYIYFICSDRQDFDTALAARMLAL